MANFPAGVDQQYFNTDNGVFKYDGTDNAWTKIYNLAQEYKDNVDYSFVVDSSLSPDFTYSFVNEGIAEMDSFGYDKNWDTVDLYDIPGSGDPRVITLNETIPMTTGTPDNGTMEIYEIFYADFWVITGSLNDDRESLGGCGSQNAALSFGGNDDGEQNTTETFNGTSWTNISSPALTARYSLAGAGIQNAALSFGGSTGGYLTTCEIFNGTIWSAAADNLNTGRLGLAGVGTQNAALSFGGNDGTPTDETETFNGTIWSNIGGTSLTSRYWLAGCGSQNAALSFGGDSGSSTEEDDTEKFNGYTWEVISSPALTARYSLAGVGIQNAALSFGGTTTGSNYLTTGETFNGTVWSTSDTLNTGRYELAGSGTQNAALSFGGTTGSVTSVTEKFHLAGSKSLRGLYFNDTNSTQFGISTSDDFYLTDSGTTLSITQSEIDISDSKIEVLYRSTNDISTDIEVTARYTPVVESSERIAVISIYDSHYPEERLTLYHINDETVKEFYLEYGDRELTGYFTDIVTPVIASLNSNASYYLSLYIDPNRLAGTMDIVVTINGTTTSLTSQPYDVSKQFDSVKALSSGTAVITDLAYNMGTSRIYLEEVMSGFDYTAVTRAERIEIDSENTYITLPVKTGNTRFAIKNNEGITAVGGYWIITADLNTGRNDSAGTGTQIAALSIGGDTTGGAVETAICEKFDGSSWSNTGVLNTEMARMAGAGTQNSALSFGGILNGSDGDITEKFDGTSWSNTGFLNTERYFLAGAGIQNVALCFGGWDSTYSVKTEKFNGSSWSNTGDLNTARYGIGGAGTQSAALGFGGTTGSNSDVTEKFDGYSWSTVNVWDLNTARAELAGAGTQNSALSFGGNDVTEKFDGATWTATGDLNISRAGVGGTGTQNAALAISGNVAIATVELFYTENSISFISPNDVQTSASNEGEILVNQSGITLTNPTLNIWTITGSMVTGRYILSGVGTQEAGLAFGGTDSGNEPTTEKFDGTSWSVVSGGDLTDPRQSKAAAGIQNAALSFAGNAKAVTEKFDGNTWSSIGGWDLSTTKSYTTGCGTQNAALCIGGSSGSELAVTEKFNGDAWSTIGGWDLSAGKDELTGVGSQSAALCIGGSSGAGGLATTEKFDGDAWSTIANWDLNKVSMDSAGAGTQSAALNFSSNQTSAITELFNGNSWSADSPLNIIKNSSAGYGNQGSAMSIGGNTTGNARILETEKTITGNSSIDQEQSLQVIIRREVPFGVWIAEANMNTARTSLAGCGSKNATLSFGGYIAAITDITELFNGDSWIDSGVTTLTDRQELGGAGTQNAAISFGGNVAGVSDLAQIFNGTTWSAAANNLGTAIYGLAGAGTQNSTLSFGGTGATAVTEKFNGIIWSTQSAWDLNTARVNAGGTGIQSAALNFGGTSDIVTTEIFNGTSWSFTGDLNTGRDILGGSGIQNSTLSFGGDASASASNEAELFNGNSWSITGSLNTARWGLAGAGTQNTALSFGGDTGSVSAVTESFQGHRSTPFFELVY